MHSSSVQAERSPLRIFTAKRIYTMDESLPTATCVGVIEDRIVAVGDLAAMAPWREGREVIVDDSLRDNVLMPGFIDNHVHPFLGALLCPWRSLHPRHGEWRGGESHRLRTRLSATWNC